MPLRLMLCFAAIVPCAALLSACGDDSSDELRSREASSLRSTLSEVEQRVESQDCTGASAQAAAFRDLVDGLPQRVDSGLRRALASSADRLETLVADQCGPEPAAPADVPEVGTTGPDQSQGNEQDQPGQGKKDKKPKKEKPNQDQTPTQTQPDTGGTGEEVPGVGDQGGGASPEG
ncbi:MAG TPA: hypothetical protein VFB51_12515 [Solirubrobacterales bacterium]|nr:hypothetical protein [Solirubrobacterales bacterium]